jgi:fluoride ion exporter CrcB/FEX
LGDNNDKNKKDKKIWRLWDVIFTSGLLSIFIDSQEAQNNDKKFKQMLLQILLGIILSIIMFMFGFWIWK